MSQRRGLAVLAVCLIASITAGCNSDESRPPPREFFGLVAEEVLALPEERERGLDAISETGVGLIRETFDWAAIERRPGNFDFAEVDRQVRAAARHGLTLMPIVQHVPAFHAAKAARRGSTAIPRRPELIRPFLRALVRRYGPRGTLWRDRAEVAHPIRAWQIWNEPNLPFYWAGQPDPAAYTRLLAAAALAPKKMDSGATVISAGLPESKFGLPRRTFLAGMIAAGALDHMDAVGVHSYAKTVDAALEGLDEVRATLDRAEAETELWVTEFGWATQGPKSPFTVSPATQAERIREFLERTAARREELRLRGIVYFNWRDSKPPEGISDFFGLHTGLLTLSREQKPGFDAFVETIREFRGD